MNKINLLEILKMSNEFIQNNDKPQPFIYHNDFLKTIRDEYLKNIAKNRKNNTIPSEGHKNIVDTFQKYLEERQQFEEQERLKKQAHQKEQEELRQQEYLKKQQKTGDIFSKDSDDIIKPSEAKTALKNITPYKYSVLENNEGLYISIPLPGVHVSRISIQSKPKDKTISVQLAQDENEDASLDDMTKLILKPYSDSATLDIDLKKYSSQSFDSLNIKSTLKNSILIIYIPHQKEQGYLNIPINF